MVTPKGSTNRYQDLSIRPRWANLSAEHASIWAFRPSRQMFVLPNTRINFHTHVFSEKFYYQTSIAEMLRKSVLLFVESCQPIHMCTR